RVAVGDGAGVGAPKVILSRPPACGRLWTTRAATQCHPEQAPGAAGSAGEESRAGTHRRRSAVRAARTGSFGRRLRRRPQDDSGKAAGPHGPSRPHEILRSPLAGLPQNDVGRPPAATAAPTAESAVAVPPSKGETPPPTSLSLLALPLPLPWPEREITPSPGPTMPSILTVDDEAGIRAFLHDTLAAASHDVQEAADGDAAMRALEDRPFDVMLLDLRMPGSLDG